MSRERWTPLVAGFEAIEVYQGDVIEVEPTTEGCHRFVRVVERGRFEHPGFVVGPAFLESGYFDAFAAALEAAGGSWEVLISGWLLTHLPAGSSFDLAEQLFARANVHTKQVSSMRGRALIEVSLTGLRPGPV